MNERIRELFEQHTVPNFGYELDVTRKFNPILEDHWQTFQEAAELIVRECLAHGKLAQSQAVVNGSEEYNAGRAMGIEVFMNQIKRHFGVEE
jgi:hypothetical protein